MRYVLFCLMLFMNCLSATPNQLVHLCTEEPEYLHYRCLMLKSTANRLQIIAESLPFPFNELISKEVDTLNYTIGERVVIEDDD